MPISRPELRSLFQQIQKTGPRSLGEEQALSRDIDLQTGLNSKLLEEFHRAKGRSYNSEVWCHVPLETFQTPYPELLRLAETYPASRWIELGAGYGRLGLVLGVLDTKTSYLGLELVPERCEAANKRFSAYALEGCQVKQQDLLADPSWIHRTPNPTWTNYFIYDFSHLEDQRRLLTLFRERPEQETPFRILARGRSFRQLILNEAPWMVPIEGAQHGPTTSIFEINGEGL